ncbi:replication initiation protein, partial [Sphingomonas koreensis]
VDDKRSYDRWQALKVRVLDPALDAINDFGTVDVTMTPKKVGRSVVAVRFDWRWKDPLDAADTVAENERHSSARRKDPPDSPDAPPLMETEPDPVVREGMAKLLGSLGDKLRNADDGDI